MDLSDLFPSIVSGQYHEVNPGQYHEVNPGQYHEVNPGQYYEPKPSPYVGASASSAAEVGQYHEVNPGQYHEVNPGQYHEVNPGQYDAKAEEDDLKVEVEVERDGDRRVYNVQSKVDEFIIGEYGTINEQSGQTLQGVRYTAVDDSSIDPKLIFDTLVKYFNFS